MKVTGLFSRAHRQRYRQVLSVVAKYGFDEFLNISQISRHSISHRLKPDPKIASLPRWVRMRLMLEELGGAFVKIGQLLSNRPDLMPDDLIEELEKLQDSVPPFSGDQAIDIIESELKGPLADYLLMFDETPLASASISQVHRAVLLDGSPVVIKVRRPGLKDKFKVDLDVATYLSQHLARLPTLESQFNNQNPIAGLRHEIEKELNFQNEANNINRFAQNFKDDDRIHVPKVYHRLSTKRVLTLSYIDGIKINHISKLKNQNHDLSQLANNLVDLGIEQIFTHRFFHGDPHPGNLLVLENGQIGFIDFGLMGTLSSKQKYNLIDLMLAFSRKDAQAFTNLIVKNSTTTIQDVNKLENEIDGLLSQYFTKSLQEINTGELLKSILNLIFRNHITLSPNSYLLMKAALSYEGLGRRLDPDFQVGARVQPLARKIILERFSPKKITKDVYLTVTDTLSLLRDLPGDFKDLINQLQSGRLNLNVDVVDLKNHIDYVFKKIDRTANRIIYALVLSALIIGSALALNVSTSLQIGGVSFIAGVGFITAGILALGLVISIFRRGSL